MSHNFDAAHEAIQRQLASRSRATMPLGSGAGGPTQAQPPVWMPHPPPAAAPALTTGPSRRASTRTAHVVPLPQQPFAAAVPAEMPVAVVGRPAAHESLPYHRKRLLELVDPPTYEHVLHDTGRHLGVDLAARSDLRWIVEALFLAPLPQGVVRCYDEQGRAYYHDRNTATSSWRHPCTAQFEALLKAQPQPQPPQPQRAVAVALSNEESKTNDDQPPPANHADSISSTPTRPASSTAAAVPHTRRFLSANAGISSTSSLFLTEAELAAWRSDSDEHHSHSEDGSDTASIDDEFGGRDGQRWHGEGDDDASLPPRRPRPLSQQRRRATAPTRPSSSYGAAASSASTSNPWVAAAPRPASAVVSHPAPWNTAQPATFHPFVNASGIGDTEMIVPAQGSLIAEYSSRASGPTDARTAPSSRPGSAVRWSTRPLSAFSTTSSAQTNGALESATAAHHHRARHSATLRTSQKSQRQRINGQLRETASHLYTIRQTLVTKASALERLRKNVLVADERVWLGVHRDMTRMRQVTEERLAQYHLAYTMLDATDASQLHQVLDETLDAVQASLARIEHEYLAGCRDLMRRVGDLRAELRTQIDATQEVLRVDTACLELGQNGATAPTPSATKSRPGSAVVGAQALPPPSTSLPVIQALLNRVLDFQSETRAYHAAVSARLASEKSLLEHLGKANALLLRRGAQHCSERKARVLQELLANKAQVPSLQMRVRTLKDELKAQMRPLEVCQRTYELRTGGRGVPPSANTSLPTSPRHSLQQQAPAAMGPLGDENQTLLRSLEDELAALTTLVTHLESELSLTQEQLAACLETDRLKKSELSTEDVRMKFYKSMLQTTVDGKQPHFEPNDEVQAHAHSHAIGREYDHQQQYQHHRTGVGHSRSVSPDRRNISPRNRGPPAQHASVRHAHEESKMYRADPARVGTYLHSFEPSPVPDEFDADDQYEDAYAHAAHHYPHPAPSPPPSQQQPVYGTGLGGSGRPRPLTASSSGARSNGAPAASPPGVPMRPTSAASTSASAVAAYETALQRSRAQLVRDAAALAERVRTRKVRRAKHAAPGGSRGTGAGHTHSLNLHRLQPNAGRPVFESAHASGYDS